MEKKKIVISAVNIFEGGTLSVVKGLLLYLDTRKENYTVLALVSKVSHYESLNLRNVEYREFPLSRKSYFFRLFYEYIYFHYLSKKLNTHIWFSAHDMTPNVFAKYRLVYCHNPSPFRTLTFSDLLYAPSLFLFTLFYKYVYQINLKKNDLVVVQQKWIRDKFVEHYCLNYDRVVVNYPIINYGVRSLNVINSSVVKSWFIYPALSRPFKNFEILCEAVKILIERGKNDFKVYLTIDGSESMYSKAIYKRYHKVNNIVFTGVLSFESLYALYAKCGVLIFPSKLETWGLPISEFKQFERPMFLANLPYARETVGDYKIVSFFNPDSPVELANLMEDYLNDSLSFHGNNNDSLDCLFGWEDLFSRIDSFS